jgi:phage terminase large subunit-like protein
VRRFTSDWLASLKAAERAAILANLTEEELEVLHYDWEFWGRPDQQAPSAAWFAWVIQAGRGWGKTRTIAELVIKWAQKPGTIIHIVARTAADYRDVIVKGPAGILAWSPPWFRPKWNANDRRLTWPNGSTALCFSAAEPDQLRGPQCHKAVADEVAAWRYPEALSNLVFGCRLGENPQIAIASTPKPTTTFKDALKLPSVVITRGATKDNKANLAKSFIQALEERYKGTRLGRQELEGELLDDNPGALWRRSWLEEGRITRPFEKDPIVRIAVAVDPGASDKKSEDVAEHGIVVCGRTAKGHGIVLDDVSCQGSPQTWAVAAVKAYHDHGANVIVAEANQGGAMVKHTIHTIDPTIPVVLVWASHAKEARAEPISSLYEQEKMHHMGVFAELEDQMCEWEPGKGMKSPDRLDALVWGFTHLFPARSVGVVSSNY